MYVVLIIDDDQELLSVLDVMLTNEGFRVVTSEPIYDIFPLIDQHKPDLIVLDYLMTPVNGGELCHSIKKNSKTSSIPVIIFSAYDRVFKAIGDYGCNLFIPKIMEPSLLIREVNRLLALQTKEDFYA
jgi:CheY-like chemotaxis protein